MQTDIKKVNYPYSIIGYKNSVCGERHLLVKLEKANSKRGFYSSIDHLYAIGLDNYLSNKDRNYLKKLQKENMR